MSDNTTDPNTGETPESTKAAARAIQSKLGIGYMKALRIVREMESFPKRRHLQRIDNASNQLNLAETDISESSYLLPVATLSDQWIIMETVHEEPVRWLELFNRDIKGNLIDHQYEPVSIDFLQVSDDGNRMVDHWLDDFEDTNTIRISGDCQPRLMERLSKQFDTYWFGLTNGYPNAQYLKLKDDYAERVEQLKTVSEFLRENIEWGLQGPALVLEQWELELASIKNE